MAKCFNTACPYCTDYQCKRTCTCNMRLDGEYVKIVRCKDCMYLHDHECPISWGKTDDDYCSFAERKDEVEIDIDENWYSDEYRRIGEDERDEVEE